MELGLSLGGLTFGIAKVKSDPTFSHSRDGSPASSFEMSKKKSEEIEETDCKKKLRLSKDQSAFLEESYKEHITLTPKQKGCLAKKLDLHPRQVEVWFQNRRARSKLKQTEVDCENLRRRCETLAEENTKLHQELQDLRALNSSNPILCFQSPATTLTICPSCQISCDTKTSDAAPST